MGSHALNFSALDTGLGPMCIGLPPSFSASLTAQKKLFRGGVITLLGVQPVGGLRCRPCEAYLDLAPFAIAAAIARVIAENILIAQFMADLGRGA